MLMRSGLAQQPMQAGSSNPAAPAQTVYTMKGEYDLQPQGDGKNFLLRRLGRDGRPLETVAVTRISETRGETKYVDQSGEKIYHSYGRQAGGRSHFRAAFSGTGNSG